MLTFLVGSFSFAQTEIFNDGLNYTNESLLTDNGWNITGTSTTEAITVGIDNGLSYAGYNDGASSYTGLTAGNAAKLDQTGQDVNKTFTAVNSGSLYYTFLVNVADGRTGYFAHLSNGTTFVAKAFVRPSATSGKINFGIANSNTGTYSTNDYELNTTYLLVVKYEFGGTTPVSLWVLSSGIPASEIAAGAPVATTSGAGVTQITGVNLRQYDADQDITVDGLYITNTWFKTTPCSLNLLAETSTCDAVTVGLDTYTITIPFTGGNSGTYNFSTNVGTLGGDNPSTTATGNITISNIPEGTNATLTMTGTCGLTKTILASQCKPTNTLPYNEPFDYTVGNILTNEQRWSMDNIGDDILVATGNLSYPGITPTGNSISFVGGGAESRTPFTSTDSGNIFASFIVNISNVSTIPRDLTDVTYFALFNDNGTGSTNARIWHRRNGDKSQFGLSTDHTPDNVVWSPNLYTPGTNIYLSLGYNFTSHLVTLVENPTIGNSAVASVSVTLTEAISEIGGFMFRQDSNNTTPAITIDELRVDTTSDYTLSTASFNNITGLNIYPNPANDVLHITTSANEIKTIAIYDVMGKEVFNTTTANETINITSLNAGVYIIKITEEGKTATRKLVIK
ncbi:hypothetical protein FEDK69T_09240 [Flavobacterium enshiense DK69]|nr:hypothetical protein FEDK69T_09240 [Flavobacterium enshiense DK69]